MRQISGSFPFRPHPFFLASTRIAWVSTTSIPRPPIYRGANLMMAKLYDGPHDGFEIEVGSDPPTALLVSDPMTHYDRIGILADGKSAEAWYVWQFAPKLKTE